MDLETVNLLFALGAAGVLLTLLLLVAIACTLGPQPEEPPDNAAAELLRPSSAGGVTTLRL